MKRTIALILFALMFASAIFCPGATSQAQTELPKLILDADTANEIDDMYAIVRMMKQDKFDVIALTSTQWIHYLAEPNSVQASQQINVDLMKLLGISDLPLPLGSEEPMGKPWGGDDAKDSEAAQFIIQSARDASPEQKLMVVCLGASTNLASAIKLAPEIAANIDAYVLGFHFDLESGVWNKSSFNIRRDLNAADFILNCVELELHIMPTNVSRNLQFARDATFERHESMGELGTYLTDKWNARFAEFETWIMWDLALVEAIINSELATSSPADTPPENQQRKVDVFRTIDAEAMQADYWRVAG